MLMLLAGCMPRGSTLAKQEEQRSLEEERRPNLIRAFRIRWAVGKTVHDALLLLLEDGTGAMRVRFGLRGKEPHGFVEMRMLRRRETWGVAVYGNEPIDLTTGRPHPTYVPDNLVVGTNANGTETVMILDRDYTPALAEVTRIQSTQDLVVQLKDFRWNITIKPAEPAPGPRPDST